MAMIYYDAQGNPTTDLSKATRSVLANPDGTRIESSLPGEGQIFLIGGSNDPKPSLAVRQGGQLIYLGAAPGKGQSDVQGLVDYLGLDYNKLLKNRYSPDVSLKKGGEEYNFDYFKQFSAAPAQQLSTQYGTGLTPELQQKLIAEAQQQTQALEASGKFQTAGTTATGGTQISPISQAIDSLISSVNSSNPFSGIPAKYSGQLSSPQQATEFKAAKSLGFDDEQALQRALVISNPTALNQPAAPAGGTAAPKDDLKTVSIVDYLASIGQPNDFTTRAKLAREQGIINYTGTAEQNTRLLSILRGQESAPDAQKPPTAPPNVSNAPDVQDELNNLNLDANQEQDSDLAAILAKYGGDVDLSASSGLLETITGLLNQTINQPKTPSLLEEFNRQRELLGVGELESSLADADARIARLKTDFASTIEEEGARRVSVGQIRRRQSAQEIEYNKQLNQLTDERNDVANQLNMKYGTINTIMTLTGQDYANARGAYEFQFNSAIQLTNLIRGITQDAKTDAERKTDNARANLQIVQNLMQTQQKTYADLDPSMQADLRSMELQAGLPSGFTQFASDNFDDPIKSLLSEYIDVSGNWVLPVLLQKADGSTEVQSMILGKVKESGGGSTTKPTAGVKNALLSGGFTEDQVIIIDEFVKQNGVTSALSDPNLSEQQKSAIRKAYGVAEPKPVNIDNQLNALGWPAKAIRQFKQDQEDQQTSLDPSIWKAQHPDLFKEAISGGGSFSNPFQ